MKYQRHPAVWPLSKLIEIIAYDTEINGIENLDYAHATYQNLTLNSSHTSNMDFFVLNSILTSHLGWENHPIFIYRDNLRAPFLFGKQMPKWISTLIIENWGKSVPINQKAGKKGLMKSMDYLDDVFKEGKHPILFSGATREFGLQNPMIERTTNLYSLFVRNKLIKDHAHFPVYIEHDKQNKSSIISFGTPLEDRKNYEVHIGREVWLSLADMAGEDISNLINNKDKYEERIKEVRGHIRKEERVVHD